MSKDIIFFDSNILFSHNDVYQLIAEKELKKFTTLGKIYFPDIVFEEVKKTKKENIKKLLDNLKGNRLFTSLFNNDDSFTFDIDAHIDILVSIINIEYSIVYLTDSSKLFDIKDMAIKKLPPFEGKSKESDKGFKDVYIYFTILEFIEKNQDNIYLIAKDGLLKDAFSNNHQVSTHSSYEDYINSRLSYYGADYFVEQLSAELDEEIKSKDIKSKYITSSNLVQLKIEVNSKKINVFCDYFSKELIEYEMIDASDSNKKKYIKDLEESTSFEKTHVAIEGLSKYADYSEQQEEILLDIFLTNKQVYWIATDDDIEKFFRFVEKEKKYINGEKWKEFRKHF